MNTAALTAAVRFHRALPAGLPAALKRAGPAPTVPAAPAARQLEKSATTWIADPLGRTIACETGTLWLTFDNEPQDVILEAGQSYRCAKASKLAIRAMDASRWSRSAGCPSNEAPPRR